MTSELRQSGDKRIRANGAIVERTAAAALRPDARQRVSEWAAAERIVAADASVLPGPWNNDLAPELVEIMDRLSPDEPCENVILMKCAQSGGSEVGCNWLGYIMHKTPGPAMYINVSIPAAKDWRAEKLDPTIRATPALNPEKGGVVYGKKSRSGEGSTLDRLKFRGGYVLSQARTLPARCVSTRSASWSVTIAPAGPTTPREGDPKELSDRRLKTYRRFGLAKVLDISHTRAQGQGYRQGLPGERSAALLRGMQERRLRDDL